MKVSVLHISDCHFRDHENSLTEKVRQIASTAFTWCRESVLTLIAVTGDIANTGRDSEYAEATQFLLRLRDLLRTESGQRVEIVLCAGNHDCVLLPEHTPRTLVVSQVVSNPDLSTDPAIVAICVEAQKDFFEFQKRISPAPLKQHPLWNEYYFEIAGARIRVSSLNAAWMSRIPEVPGELVYPIQQFAPELTAKADLRLALIHHPLNWYGQASYRAIRSSLREHAHAVLSGHEHEAASGGVTDRDYGHSLFFEAGRLDATEGKGPYRYSLMQFDLATRKVLEQRVEVHGDDLDSSDPVEFSFDAKASPLAESALTLDIAHFLRDPGGAFMHPIKGQLERGDVFVYPELKVISSEMLSEDISSELLLRDDTRTLLLLLGDEEAGKTTLLKTSFDAYHCDGKVPVLLEAGSFKSVADVPTRIGKTIKDQYRQPDYVSRAPKADKIALVDDIHDLARNPKVLSALIAYLREHYGKVLLTADKSFRIGDFASSAIADALKDFESFEILPFGFRLRRELAKKWVQCGRNPTHAEMDTLLHGVETVFDSVIGKNLVPRQPFYLLILLQSIDQQQHADLQASSFAYYYQFLITASLTEAGVKRNDMHELYNYLAALAWFLRSRPDQVASHEELSGFNKQYSENFVTVVLEERLALLARARIVSQSAGVFRFTYPYIYYFFLGLHLHKNLSETEVRSAVAAMCADLRGRDNANTILFLSHHTHDKWVIEQVAEVMRKAFEQSSILQLESDVGALNGLVDSTAELIIKAPDVEQTRKKVATYRDEQEREGDGREEPSQGEMFDEFTLMIRTGEILGQILKNYYGSLDRPLKHRLLGDTFNAPLRFLHSILARMAGNPEGLVKEVSNKLSKQKPEVDPKKRESAARRIAFRMLGMLMTAVLYRTAQFVSSDRLQEDIDRVSDGKSLAYRILGLAARLAQPGPVPLSKVKALAEELEGNHVAFEILQSLGALRLHLFYMSESEKQALCAHLKINLVNAHMIDVRASAQKLLPAKR